MSFRSEFYRTTPGLRTRPVPELGICVVYTPAEPRLFNLNTHAWLILELAPGKTHEQLASDYAARVVPPLTAAVAEGQLRDALEMLTSQGMLELVAAAEASA